MNKKIKVSDLQADDRNANRHTHKGQTLLAKSIIENGYGRSILISADNKIIAGNGLIDQAKKLNAEDCIIVESDGRKPVAIRRTDIKSGTDAFYQMSLADNIVAMHGISMDSQVVEAIAVEYQVKGWEKEITPADTGHRGRVSHATGGTLTLKFSASQLQAVKKTIAESGKTAEEVVLKALKINITT